MFFLLGVCGFERRNRSLVGWVLVLFTMFYSIFSYIYILNYCSIINLFSTFVSRFSPKSETNKNLKFQNNFLYNFPPKSKKTKKLQIQKIIVPKISPQPSILLDRCINFPFNNIFQISLNQSLNC